MLGGMQRSRGTLLTCGAIALATALTLVGCAPSGPSAACESSVLRALAEEQTLYDTHPVWDLPPTTPDSSPEQFAEFDRLMADENARWTEIYSQIYASCEDPADWWAAAKNYPGIAGLTDTRFLKPEDIEIWCTDSVDQPACTGIDAWLATNPS